MRLEPIAMTGPLTQSLRIDPSGRLLASTERVSVGDTTVTTLTIRDGGGTIRYEQTLGDLLGAAIEWSPVDSVLAYVAMDADDTPQAHIVRICADGTETFPLEALPYGVTASDLDWAPDGQSVLVAGRTVGRPVPGAAFRISRRIWRYEGLGLIDESLTDLCQVHLDGRVRWLGLSSTGVLSHPRWSPDGTSISYLSAFEQIATPTPCPSLCVWSLADPPTSATELVPTDWGWITATLWLRDSRRILFLGARHEASEGLFASRRSLWRIDAEEAVERDLTDWLPGGAGSQMQSDLAISWPVAASTVALLADGRTAAFTAEHAGRTYVAAVDVVTGKPSSHTVASNDASYALLCISDGDRGTDLMVLESAIDLAPRVLRVRAGEDWSYTSRAGQPSRLLDVKQFAIPSLDGLSIDTWVVLPPRGQAPFPAVLKIHGGPNGSIGDVYGKDTEVLARAGFAVVLHNFRGSYGYGADFSQRITANWGELGEPDHHAVLDYLSAQGLIDGERLGVMGHSHGGFAACWLIGRSDRFAAAVAEDPPTNFHDLALASDVGPLYFPAEFGLALSGPPAGFLDRSPIAFAECCTTPLLLIQGEQDLRCPPNQSDQMYAALWEYGCRVEMLRLPESDHMGSFFGSHGYREVRIRAALDWFSQHLIHQPTSHSAGKAHAK